MGTIPALTTFVDATTAVAADVNSNFTNVRDTFNTFAVLTDTARTITATHSYSITQTFTGGWTAGAGCTVSAGTTAVQALTATTGVFSSTLNATAITGTTGTFSGAINGQTLSATASLTGTLTVATGLTVTAGTSALQAVTCTAISGMSTLAATTATFTTLAGAANFSGTPTFGAGLTVTAGLVTASAGLTVTGAKATTAATVAGYASLNLPHGTAPTSPVNGDMWTTTAGAYVQVNGTTVGPLLDSTNIVTGTGTATRVPLWSSTSVVGDSNIVQSVSGHIHPVTHDTYDLGITGTRWKNIYARGGDFSGAVIASSFTSAIIDNSGGAYTYSGTQVVAGRRTGWTAATGTATRTTFATSTVTTAQLAERVKALLDDLIVHGLIGA